MTTVHANTPRDALSRIEAMVGMGGVNMSEALVRQTIARALNVVIQLSRGTDGKRRITSVSEITDMEGRRHHACRRSSSSSRRGTDKDGKIIGEFRFTGMRPQAMERIERYGIDPAEIIRPYLQGAERDMQIILIGVLAFTAVALLEALVHTLRFFTRPAQGRAQAAPAVARDVGGHGGVRPSAQREAVGHPGDRRDPARRSAVTARARGHARAGRDGASPSRGCSRYCGVGRLRAVSSLGLLSATAGPLIDRSWCCCSALAALHVRRCSCARAAAASCPSSSPTRWT